MGIGLWFFLLQVTLGLSIDSLKEKVVFQHSILPEFLQEVIIKNITFGKSQVDILLQRQGKDVSINISSCKGQVEMIVRK